jgi:hypothetical protein
MATHRATFEVTAGTDGYGSDDVRLKLPSTLVRHAQLLAVGIDETEAVGGEAHITISELDVDDDDAETPGDILFYTENVRPGPITVVSDEAVVTTNDTVLSGDVTGGGIQFIRTASLRTEVDNAANGDVFTVDVYYETSGDYRF